MLFIIPTGSRAKARVPLLFLSTICISIMLSIRNIYGNICGVKRDFDPISLHWHWIHSNIVPHFSTYIYGYCRYIYFPQSSLWGQMQDFSKYTVLLSSAPTCSLLICILAWEPPPHLNIQSTIRCESEVPPLIFIFW